MNQNLCIVSLLPSATEILAGLGLTDCIVGRSHECDFPPSIERLPVCTEPKFDPTGTSGDIHQRVTHLLQSALSVYRVKTDVLRALQPTHIITQAQCEVCAVSLKDVEQAIAELTHGAVTVVSLQPNRLDDVWADIERVSMAIDADALPGAEVVARLRERVQRIAAVTQAFPIAERPTLACIEWTEPLMAAGNWVPQLVELAGGRCAFGTVGEHSPWLQWDDLLAADPDAIAVMPCGYDLERTQQDLQQLAEHPRWNQLQAVQHGKVYVTDGNAYFNRPGPRLVESLEILAEILHPEQFDFGHRGQGWRQWRLDDPVATSSRQLQMAGQDLVRVERFL